MFNLWKFKIAALHVAKAMAYIVSIPVMAVVGVYGTWFILAFMGMIVLVDAIAVSALLIFLANFFMAFAAIVDESIWSSMASMWQWAWSWFTDGTIFLWPHFVASTPLYVAGGLSMAWIVSLIHRLNLRAKAIKQAAAI